MSSVNKQSLVEPSAYRSAWEVLVIETEEDTRFLAYNILSKQGFEVRTVSDGYAALAIVREEIPDLIILDSNLKSLDGFQIIKNIKFSENPRIRSIPIIVFSSNTLYTQVEKCRLAGAKAYLTKPVPVHKFLQTIQECLENSTHTNKLSKKDNEMV